MSELVLYAFRGRSRAERVLWVLRELELAHRVVRLDASKGENRSAAFLKLSPEGKVPILVDGDRVWSESMAICFHLCRRSDRVSLIPAGEAESAVFYQRLFYGVTEVEPYLWLADKERFVRNEAMPAGIADYSIHKVTRAFGSINRWLAAAPYIAGDAFTLADVLYFHLVTWAAMYGVSLAPATAKYVEALASRPAFPPGMAMAGPPPLAG